MSFLTDLASFEFLRYSLTASFLVAFLTGLVSPVIVYKRMEFIGDGLAHAIFAGVAFAVLLQFNIFLGSVLATLVFAYLVYLISKKEIIAESTAIGMLLPVFMAIGVIVFSKSPRYTTDVTAYLFGNLLLISKSDVLLIALILAIVTPVILLNKYEIAYWIADEKMAEFYGIKTKILKLIVLFSISMVVISSLKLAGVIVMGAFLVLPGVFAKQFANSFGDAISKSVIFSIVFSLVGYISAYYFDTPPGPTIVLSLFVGFLLSLPFNKYRV
ncbi:metal ABC transporter permease [Fervidobacterium riparium]|nr:metal ABC transporter permease [Fervidobacterium riparium]